MGEKSSKRAKSRERKCERGQGKDLEKLRISPLEKSPKEKIKRGKISKQTQRKESSNVKKRALQTTANEKYAVGKNTGNLRDHGRDIR